MSAIVNNTISPEYYIDLAAREHARINLFFTLDMCHISNIRTTCVMIKNGHFVVSVPIEEVEREPIVWGTETSGYFTVRDDDLVHCHFRSRLARIYNGPPNAMFLVFPLPASIDHQQRRFSRRISLNAEEADKFQMWHGGIEENDDKLPLMQWRSLSAPTCALGDISSSGLRVDISEKNSIAEIIDINDPVLLHGDFGQPGKPLPLSLIAIVRRKMPAQKEKDIVSIGCNFLKWRKINGADSHTWFKPEADVGVSPVSQWIARNFRGSKA